MTRGSLACVVIAAAALVGGCGPRADGPGPKATGPATGKAGGEVLRAYPNSEYPPSFVQLLAHPDRYDGQEIAVDGFLHVRFEGMAIYLSRDDAEHLITRNGFWVSFDRKAVPFEGAIGPKQFDAKYVHIEGTFNAGRFGHAGLWKGAIENVTRVYELRRRP